VEAWLLEYLSYMTKLPVKKFRYLLDKFRVWKKVNVELLGEGEMGGDVGEPVLEEGRFDVVDFIPEIPDVEMLEDDIVD
jgi:hypothetical protein